MSAGVTGIITAGKDIINSFGGTDIVEGGGGDDTVFMGDGTDTFTWRPGDGSRLRLWRQRYRHARVQRVRIGIRNHRCRPPMARRLWRRRARGRRLLAVAGTVEIEEVDRIEITTGREGHFVRIAGLDGTRVSKVAVDLAAAAATLPATAWRMPCSSGIRTATTRSRSPPLDPPSGYPAYRPR